MNAIFKRTSVRKYTDQPVEPEKIELLLRAAMAAPSACNQQPWEFYLTDNKEKLTALGGCSRYATPTIGAPLAIVPCYRKDGLIAPDYAEIDLSACVENILLEVEELGLGAVWMGIAPGRDRMENVRKVLGVDDSLEPFAIISVGYPAVENKQQDRFDPARIHWVK
ncbi:MAG: nitroreductase family protein [Oscillospiraceae bacterium]|nr:nitroreductase family protein [Oscillospiraceae bacterium]